MKKLCYMIFMFLGIFIFNVQGQTGVVTYDFRDGTIVSAHASTDGSLKLSGTYSYHGTSYGMNMKVNGVIKVAVSGNSTFKFLGSKYSSLKMQATTSKGVDLGTQNTQVTQDLSDTYDFVYEGAADTISFKTIASSGNDLYLLSLQVIPQQLGGAAELTSAVKNLIYFFDLRDGSIIPNQTSLNGNYTIEKGLFKIECGPNNAYGYNGAQHGSILKTGNTITLKVAGNSKIKIGGCQYSNGTIAVSSTTGIFDVNSKASKTAACYDADGSTVDFLYVGSAGEVKLTFTGTTYIPVIKIVPVPFNVELTQWVQKTGEVVVNGVAVGVTSGATSSDKTTVTVAAGTVISSTADLASIRINLGGKSLADVTKTFSGDISAVSVSKDTLKITYNDANTKPYSYKILVADNSQSVSAEAGKTYNYNFFDGSVLPQVSYTSLRYKTFISADGLLTLNSNTETAAQQFGYHDAAHGAVLFPGNSMDLVVAGNATITFGTCQYGSATDAIFEVKDANGNVLGNVQAKDTNGACETHTITYTGSAGVLTATLKSTLYPAAEVYIHGVSVENAAKIIKTNKADVWDFGAAVLDTAKYNNKLTVDIMNGWYPGVTAGTTAKPLPGGFTVGVLSWVGGTNSDRIRTSNTSLTRYDSNGSPAYVANDTLTGSLYVNASATSARYLGLTLSADDEVTIYAKSQNGAGKMTFEYMADATQKDVAALTSSVGITKFVAKKGGSYHIYDSADKPSYYRIIRKDATYVTLSGNLNTTEAAGIPVGYSIVFTNDAGKMFADTIKSGESTYSIQVPSGYSYGISLGDANGYIVTNGTTVTLNADATREIAIKKVITNTMSGSIVGLNSTLLAKTKLKFTPVTAKIYVPAPVINTANSTYSVSIEPNCKYKITASGINDYYIVNDSVIVKGDSVVNLTFAAKPTYKITIDPSGLNETQKSKLNITFTNLNESGYSYKFTKLDSIYLRTGVYSIACSGLDEYPLQLGATSKLKVNSAVASKTLAFTDVTNWSFDDATITSGVTTAYKGMLFTGTVANEIAKGHLVLTGTSTAKVPVKVGQKMVITYYYSAKFVVVEGDTVKTTSGSTSIFETKEYAYSGTTDGYMTISNVSGTTSYITDVKVASTIPYSAVVTVGTGKDFQTINAALSAVRAMNRPSKARVKIMVDPGNYEEMLMIDADSVSIINASTTPSIALKNKGVDIDENAVRITSYYGHGYNYYSMGNDQKWNADALRVNKENGYSTYANTGSGTTNGSYWNATVVVSAKGFQASNIIFENSFNQYISKKESEDVVMEWASGGKGTRPTDIGNTAVQNKSYVERAAAIAYTASGDKSVLYKCRVVGRQDSFYGAEGARVVTYKGSIMGGTDYIFGGMTLVAYKSDLAMNTSEVSTDVAYITAAQQSSARGYLMYGCTVTSAQPGTETASAYLSKPGQFGRPWQATTSEVVFYNTAIKATNNTSFLGKSMIAPEGWLNTLGGQSDKCYEYGTIEESGENNASSRASWSHVLTTPVLSDNTAINTFNFTKGSDSWDPLAALILADVETGLNDNDNTSLSGLKISQSSDVITFSNVSGKTIVNIFSTDGRLYKRLNITADTQEKLNKGLWIVQALSASDKTTVKCLIR